MDKDRILADMRMLSALSKHSQHKRLLSMDFPAGDGPDAVMLVNSFRAREEMSRDFRFEVEVLSDDAGIPLKAMIAKMVTVSLVRDDGTLRYFNGYVTEFRFVRTDGGFAFYAMVLEPWMAFLKLRQDCTTFHGCSVLDVTEKTFQKYPEKDWNIRLHDYDHRQLSCVNQYNETDYNHLHRRWEAAGLHYAYEHRADGHTLWLADKSLLSEPIDGMAHGEAGKMAFRSEGGSVEGDGVKAWQAVRRVGSGSVTLASFDYKRASLTQQAAGHSRNRQGEVARHELYEDTGAYGFPDSREGEMRALRRMEEHDKLTQYFEASGNDRSTQVNRSFKLTGHFSATPKQAGPGELQRPSIDAREYLILSVEHVATNNYQAGPGARSHYENSFVCIRQSVRWRPGRHYNSQPCPVPAVLTALVVGPPGEEIHTDGLGRVKVQFHWDRLGKRDHTSSAWVRVAMPIAGNCFGQSGLPRVEQEVVVVFLDGNIDRPIVIGLAYNSGHLPPWNLPGQLALSGLRSRELQPGQRSNHLVLDDTAGKIQVQLRSDHQHSQLSLGHITRIEDTAGRKDARGEGFELRTDGHGVARAAQGLLLTTEARGNAQSHMKDMGETLQRLNAAQHQHDELAKLAQQHDAKDGQGKQADVAATLKTQNQTIKGTAGGAGSFPELAAPHLVLASPAGIETTTAGSTHLASDQHTAITTGKNFSLASGDSVFASVRQAFRLFVHKAGMKMIAAAGDIELQALTDSINVLAKLNITHSANRITISAKEEVVINGGGSYAKFSAGGIEQGTNGNFVAHAAKHSLPGPKNMAVATAMPPPAKLEGKGAFHLDSHPTASGRANAGLPFKLYKDQAVVEEGAVDDDGNMIFEHDLDAGSQYAVELANGQRYVIEADPQTELDRISAGMGYHGYGRAGLSASEANASLEQDRLLANPLTRGGD